MREMWERGCERWRKGEREKRRTEGFWERQAKRGMGGVTDTGPHSCGKLLRKGKQANLLTRRKRENERLFTGSG